MPVSQKLRRSAVTAALCGATIVCAQPVIAHEHGDGHYERHHEYRDYEPRYQQPGSRMDPATRDAWLADCRERIGRRDNGLGGALIGGVVGGFAGNRIAGKHHRTTGTIAGAAVGAAAGMAIDKAEDSGRARDECEAYLADYEARYSQQHYGYGYGQHGYAQPYPAYGYGGACCQPMMMVPIMQMPRGEPECTETVEYVYEDVPVRRVVPQKRVKVVPDKRVKIVPDKRIPTK